VSRPALVDREQWQDIVRRAGPDSPLHKLDQRKLSQMSRGKRGSPEHDGQSLYFREGVPRLKLQHPDSADLFDLTYANPQQGQAGGRKAKAWGAYFAAEGKKAGVPDLTHPVGRFKYSGLYIENKIGRTAVSDEQLEWAIKLSRQGFAVVVCRATTSEALAESIERAIGRYTVFDRYWHEHIPKDEKWL
jgi:hypothetical protein